MAQQEYKVETGIPVPTFQSRHQWPLDTMKVGQSFALTADEVNGLRMAVSQRHKRKKGNGRYTIRKQAVGYRCWRVS
jgi:hypothetical protein